MKPKTSKATTVQRERFSGKKGSADAKSSVLAGSEGSTEPSWLRNNAVYVVASAIAAFALICFSNSLVNGFVFDDRIHLLDRPLLRSLSNLPRLLTESYRPLRNVSYALDFFIWGERAFGFHLTNILIHAANSVLVFLVARRITRDLIFLWLTRCSLTR
jgi:hypothetical protein